MNTLLGEQEKLARQCAGTDSSMENRLRHWSASGYAAGVEGPGARAVEQLQDCARSSRAATLGQSLGGQGGRGARLGRRRPLRQPLERRSGGPRALLDCRPTAARPQAVAQPPPAAKTSSAVLFLDILALPLLSAGSRRQRPGGRGRFGACRLELVAGCMQPLGACAPSRWKSLGAYEQMRCRKQTRNDG